MIDVTIVFTDGKEANYECKRPISFLEYGISIETTNGEGMFFPYRNFYCVAGRDKMTEGREE